MIEALKKAKKAYDLGEVPVGCVIVMDDKIISYGYNMREKSKNSLAHAEIICINKACKKLGNWRLENCTMYVTLEPCKMCQGAIEESRIKKVYYGAKRDGIENDTYEYINDDNCSKILKTFFKDIRNK